MKKDYEKLQSEFSQWLHRLGYAPDTIRGRRRHLGYFLGWLEGQKVGELSKVEQSHIEAYSVHLHQKKGRKGQMLSSKSIEAYLGVLRLLDEYRQSYGLVPLLRSMPKVEGSLSEPRRILSQAQIKSFYGVIQEDTVDGLMERAILSLYYGCGLRCCEGVRLQMDEVDLKGGLLLVARSKNHYQRYVPLSGGVKRDLNNWLRYGRHRYAYPRCNKVLLNTKGGPANGKHLNKLLKDLCEKAGIESITLHSLRHSIATHLLQDGMELAAIGRFLGHRSLEATQIYTHISLCTENGGR